MVHTINRNQLLCIYFTN